MSSDRTEDPAADEGELSEEDLVCEVDMHSEEEEYEEEEEEEEENSDEEAVDASLKEKIAWLDIETTGLDVEEDTIMEVAVVVTNSLLTVLAESPNHVIHVEDKLLTDMKQPYKDQHTKTGLIEKCKKSTLSLKAADGQLVAFLAELTEKDEVPLAGNSVHADKKKFLETYLPRVMEHLQKRVVDVKSVKELCKSWYPDEFNSAPTPDETNTQVLQRVRESIEELKYYKATLCNAVNVQL
ncbi:Oligoribonuclease, mitochondrial [Chionoecetes opilio]|uniref:Oligoribonuclease, mitochondrial n=1 Tax=Chionoecetes opilio TaxID=41210 RepID=A0A8J4Y3T1_CHIOP|nr:Oligoribonuclease, mitochondrial [Chionoecetes opilio]